MMVKLPKMSRKDKILFWYNLQLVKLAAWILRTRKDRFYLDFGMPLYRKSMLFELEHRAFTETELYATQLQEDYELDNEYVR
jgi:hypothetical protein